MFQWHVIAIESFMIQRPDSPEFTPSLIITHGTILLNGIGTSCDLHLVLLLFFRYRNFQDTCHRPGINWVTQ